MKTALSKTIGKMCWVISNSAVHCWQSGAKQQKPKERGDGTESGDGVWGRLWVLRWISGSRTIEQEILYKALMSFECIKWEGQGIEWWWLSTCIAHYAERLYGVFQKSVRQGVPKVSRSQKGGTPSDLYTKPAQPMTRRVATAMARCVLGQRYGGSEHRD